jgi:hypothetical protein
MALTELNQETRQAGAVKPTEASLEVTVSAENTWAEVTEGTMVLHVFWERCRYDWCEPTQVTATVIESNVFKPDSSWQLQASPRSGGGGSVVATTVVRDYRNGFKGTFARVVNHLGGRRLFGWFVRSALAAIEIAPEADSAINPGTPTP